MMQIGVTYIVPDVDDECDGRQSSTPMHRVRPSVSSVPSPATVDSAAAVTED